MTRDPAEPDGPAAPPEPSGRAAGPFARRRVLVLAAAATAACLAAGLGLAAASTDAPAAPPDAARSPAPASALDRRAAETVLANRARAVRDRDRTAFLATVATAPAAFQQAQAQLFDNLRKLPLDDWRERVAGVENGDGPGAVTVRVALSYRLGGYDRAPVTRTRYLAFAPRSGTWVISGLPARGPGDAEMWDGGPLTVVRGRSSLVVGDAPGLPEIARRLDRAVPAVSQVTGTGWPRRAVVLAPAGPERASALAGPDRDLTEIAALAVVTGDAAPGGGDRIIVSPATFARLNELGREVVLTHELTHIATGGARDGRTPVWLIEGLADYVGYRKAKVGVRAAAGELARDVAAGRLPDALPGPDAFEGGSARLAQSYQESWLACRMIVERYGEATLLRLYRAAGRMFEDAALRSALGVDRARFTAQWRDYLRRELR
ncbi:hypothetical protein [Actinomadura hibisca]|uniref:hypothetical protein n=1 Tax=Actinomadura hibisca TaxID=68565 RepID=UPI000B23EF49|nr:hypothetical protein [Actinomadura hibisca]